MDVIHTDSFYGTAAKTGTADFYPNGGIFMPGCAIVNEVQGPVSSVCSHTRAVEYFAESVENPQAFVAVAADSYKKFKNKIYDRNNVVYMGIACRTKYEQVSRLLIIKIYTFSANLIYYLQTNDKAPFGRGCQGRHYEMIQKTNSGISNLINIGAKFFNSFSKG